MLWSALRPVMRWLPAVYVWVNVAWMNLWSQRQGRSKVARFIVLFNWTEQGIKSYKDSPKRVDQANEAWQDLGVQVKEVYWTVGPYDLVGIIESPDVEALASALLRLG